MLSQKQRRSARLRGGLWCLLWVTASNALPACTRLESIPFVRPTDTPLGMVQVKARVASEAEQTAHAAFGAELFVETRFSMTGDLSCASCHKPSRSFSEDRARSRGIGKDARARNAPSLLNIGHLRSLGWDGRFDGLESQLESVFHEHGDFGIPLEKGIAKMKGDSVLLRRTEKRGLALDSSTIVRALATFQRTLVSGSSDFDRYMFGGDSMALTTEQRYGWTLFNESGCAGCHAPFFLDSDEARARGAAIFTDQRFHNLGIGYDGRNYSDSGRYKVTGRSEHIGAFRTPSLRNVSRTSPYMHDGSIRTLEEVVKFYERGGTRNPRIDAAVQPLRLSEDQRSALVSFLGALSEPAIPVYRYQREPTKVIGSVRR